MQLYNQKKAEVNNQVESMETNENSSVIILLQILVKVLALFNWQARTLGVNSDSVEQPLSVSEEKTSASKSSVDEDESENEEVTSGSMENVAKEEIFNPMALRKKPVDLDDDDKLEEKKPKLSKRKLKKMGRMTVTELKQKVSRSELVEMHDNVTAKDPMRLLHLKASRNTVPVPRHRCFKRKYLQGKRGIEKPAFKLPDYIPRTGITEIHQALQENEDQETKIAEIKERMRLKLRKIYSDYEKLHDVFFEGQNKPKVSFPKAFRDLCYEDEKFETRLKEKKPGDLSEDLKTALGMPAGPPQGIEVALDPRELEMNTAAMAARYEETMQEQQSQLKKEDLSDIVAEHADRQKNKRKKQQLHSAKPPKKCKEFKF